LTRRQLNWQGFLFAVKDALRITCMVMVIITGAIIFGHFIAVAKIPLVLADWVGGLPLPTGWRARTEDTIDICRLAVETNYFPLWEAENGRFHFTHRMENPKPLQEFTKLMGRFSHLKEEDLAELQQLVNERFNLIKSLCEIGD